jgi:hypothetical protein
MVYTGRRAVSAISLPDRLDEWRIVGRVDPSAMFADARAHRVRLAVLAAAWHARESKTSSGGRAE